ncbi:MAG: DUF6165 family protein [Desulfobacterales bacterium]
MKIEVSIGEVIDKLTILSIKLKKVKDHHKLENIRNEYNLLKEALKKTGSGIPEEFKELEKINLRLWDIEDGIRLKEARKEFDGDFIELARSVYLSNDERSAIKRKINLKYGSEVMEEKEYTDYGKT